MLQDHRSRNQASSKGHMQEGTQPQAAPSVATDPAYAVSNQPKQPSPASSKAESEPNIDSKVPSARSGASDRSSRGKSWTSCCPMPLTSLIPCWAGSLCIGTAMGYSLPAGRSLREAKDSGTIDITHTGIVWFGSLMTLGAVFGSLVGAVLAQRYGRRWSFLTAALGLLATWLCIGLAEHGYLFYTARFVNGFFTGFVSLVVPAHIAELALVTRRGVDHVNLSQGATHHLVITLGILYAYAIGRFLDWAWLALCCVLPPVLLLLLTFVVVESPRWLLERQKRRRAFDALLKVRTARFKAEAEVEFDAIRAIFPNYKTPAAHFMMAVLVMAVQQGSGINCIILSATSIPLTPEDMNGLVVLALLQPVVSLLALPFFDVVGRRKMIVVSVIVCSTSLVSLGFVFYSTPPAEPVTAGAADALVHSRNVIPLATASTLHEPSQLAFAFLAFFVAGYSVGLGPVSWILAGELTPLRHTGMELGGVCVANWATCFVTANFFATASTMQLLGVTLWLYSGVTVTGGLFFLALLPETAHSSIEEILLIGQDVQHAQKGRTQSSKMHLTSGTEQPAAVREDATSVHEPPQPPQQSGPAAVVAPGSAIAGAARQPLPQRPAPPASRKSPSGSRRSTASKSSDASRRVRNSRKLDQ